MALRPTQHQYFKEIELENPGLPAPLWSDLNGHLWHATNSDGLHGMIADGEIKVGFGNRYAGSFCRDQACVCLFDFGPASENIANQFENWHGWFGRQQNARVSIWLEIDRVSVLKNLIDAKETREALKRFMDKRRAVNRAHEPGILIIPGVEACHNGPIPLAAIIGILLVDQHNLNLFKKFDKLDNSSLDQIKEYESSLPAHSEDPLIQALRASRREP